MAEISAFLLMARLEWLLFSGLGASIVILPFVAKMSGFPLLIFLFSLGMAFLFAMILFLWLELKKQLVT